MKKPLLMMRLKTGLENRPEKPDIIQENRQKPRQTCSRVGLSVLIFLITSIFLLAGGALYLQVLFLTTPYRQRDVGSLPDLSYQDVSLTTADGVTISGWYVPGAQPNGIVLVHGIHANRAFLKPQAMILAEAGYHLLLIDLRGHGNSGGGKLTYGYQEALDVRAAVDYLAARPEVEQVGILGHSLGAAAVVREAATDSRLRAMVIQSSYSSLAEAVDDTFENFTVFPRRPFAPLIIALAEYRTAVEISQVNSTRDLAAMPTRPVLIIHSVNDTLFPFNHAQRMYEAAREPKELWAVRSAGHGNPIFGHEAEYQAQVLNFFAEAFAH